MRFLVMHFQNSFFCASNQNYPVIETFYEKDFVFVEDIRPSYKCFYLSNPSTAICLREELNVTPNQFNDLEEFWNFVNATGITSIWDAGSKLYQWNPAV